MIHNEPPKPDIQNPTTNHTVEIKTESSFDHSVIQNQSRLNSKYELLSGYLDGELTQQEAQKVSLLLESEADYKQLHDEMASMRQEVQSLSLQESELEHLDRLFQEPIAKTSRFFGFALLAVSATIFTAFIMYSVFINAAISTIMKFAIGTISIGGLLLLFSVLRQRLINSKNDKYKRVKI